MRYSIEGFSQEYATTLKKFVERKDRRTGNNKLVEIKIDCTDLVILRWFVDFYPNMKKMIIDGKEYAWIAHNKLVEDLPLIDISKEAFNERMKKLVEFKILGYQFVKECGSFSLYCFGENYINLVSKQEGRCSNTYGVDVQTDTGVSVQTPNKDNNTNNEKIKNNKHIYGEYKHILLTDDELNKLKEQYSNWEEIIAYLDEAIEMKGYKYKSHYLAIKKWVVEAVNKNKGVTKNNNVYKSDRQYTNEQLNDLFDSLDNI